MSTTSLNIGAWLFGASGAETKKAKREKGLFARMLDRAIAAREAEARTRVATYLHHLSDQRLMEMGMSSHDIQLMRDTGKVPPTIWS